MAETKKRLALRGGGSVLGITALALLFNGLVPTGAGATHEPANKVSAAGSAGVVVDPAETVTLMSEKIKTSKPTDLILSVSLECVITTELTTVGNDSAAAEERVRVWVEIDGKAVPVSSDDPPADAGKVTFCDRLDQRTTSLFDDEDATIKTLQRTGQANAFNWMALDVGSAVHTIEVKAMFIKATDGDATALAAVGKRTLIVEPTKAANDEAVTTLG